MDGFDRLVELASPEEWQYCKGRLAVFDDPRAGRSQLAEAANDPRILALEKKFVPQLNAAAGRETDCDTLVSTVGLRPQPILLTVLCLRPGRVFLLHTAASRPMAEQIRDDPELQASGLKPNETIILKTISETDAPHNYDVLQHEILPRVKGRIVMDPTGGVKVMGVSLAAFAFWRRIPMVYLQGEEVKGIVRPFSEQLTQVENPYDHFGDPDLALIQQMFDHGNYPGALEVCLRLLDTVHDPATLGMLSVLKELIGLYRDWNDFHHSHEDEKLATRRLGRRLGDIRDKLKRLDLKLVDEGQLEGNVRFLRSLDESWRPGRDNAEPCRLVDIFVNAERRARLGQYDDAVARLYRCLEMSATIQLAGWEIGTPDRPNVDRIVEVAGGEQALARRYRQLRSRELPAPDAPWGLDDQMAFLEIVEPSNAATAVYRTMRGEVGGEGSLMSMRNRSILAHGTIPVAKREYEQFRGKVWAVIQATIGLERFKELQGQAQHPRLLLIHSWRGQNPAGKRR